MLFDAKWCIRLAAHWVYPGNVTFAPASLKFKGGILRQPPKESIRL